MNSPFKNQNSEFRIQNCAGGFTLMELLIVMMIMTLIAGLALSALAGATESAREQRTRSIITKIDQLIMERYESYRTRAVPLRIPASVSQAPGGKRIAAQLRLSALRELMRMELPDRRTDIVDFLNNGAPKLQLPVTPGLQPVSLQRSYYRSAVRALGGNPSAPTPHTDLSKWTMENQGAECLYLIIAAMQDGDKNALDYFSSSEIGDFDGDGMKEILDAWGSPIEFLRWAPNFVIENGAVTSQTTADPDPFDPAKSDPRWDANPPGPFKPYALRPLIFSAGRDRLYDVAQIARDASNNDFRYVATTPINDPYHIPNTGNQVPFGTLGDIDQDGELGHMDNITNHFVQTP